MSLGMVYSAALHGMEVKFIRVEADLSNGLPMFHMVGYLSSEVKEAGERVRTAIRNSGLEVPVKKTVINLSPGSVRKRGASFDLPIALSILASQGLIGQEALEQAVRAGASALYHAACHTALFDARPEEAIPALQKAAFFALRLARLRRTGRYVAARRELLPLLEPGERELLGDGCTLPALMAWAKQEMAR